MNLSLLSHWQQALISSWDYVWEATSSVLPSIIGSILIIAIGIILGIWTKRIVILLLDKLELDEKSERLGVDQYLEKAKITISLSELLGNIFMWFVLLIFFLASVNVLGLYDVGTSIDGMLTLIPTALSAILIIGFGHFAAKAFSFLIRLMFVAFNTKTANLLGNLSYSLILLYFIAAALSQFEIFTNIIQAGQEGLVYAVVLAAGLLIGLGGKDMFAKLASIWYEWLRK